MAVFLNLVTGKEYAVKSLQDIPGNIINRGLSKDFIEIDFLMLEYYKQYIALKKCINSRQGSMNNRIKAINDIYRFNKE